MVGSRRGGWLVRPAASAVQRSRSSRGVVPRACAAAWHACMHRAAVVYHVAQCRGVACAAACGCCVQQRLEPVVPLASAMHGNDPCAARHDTAVAGGFRGGGFPGSLAVPDEERQVPCEVPGPGSLIV